MSLMLESGTRHLVSNAHTAGVLQTVRAKYPDTFLAYSRSQSLITIKVSPT